MNVLADECVDIQLISRLREAGWKIRSMSDIDAGAPDADVLTYAWDDECLLLTEDKDFGELVIRLGYQTHGVILCRLPDKRDNDLLDSIVSLLIRHADEFPNKFAAVNEHGIRLRKLPDLT